MIVGNIRDATRNLGAPPGWDPKVNGPCSGLPVRDEQHGPGLPRMVSAWFPDDQERLALERGAPVYLSVIGGTHPPVMIRVGRPPIDDMPHPERAGPDVALVATGYTVFRVGAEPERGSADLAHDPSPQALRIVIRPLLDGAHMEHVAVLHEGRRADMFVDESGAGKLPRNDAATAIYRANWMQALPDTDPESLPAVYGTAIVFDRRVWS